MLSKRFKSSFFLPFFLIVSISPVVGFFQFQQQQQQQPIELSYEERILNNDCDKYLCPDTLACVASKKDCPCPFPKSQLKCLISNERYVCISKPATHDEEMNAVYDDPVKGPKAAFDGMRDCGWVKNAYNLKL
ncbi:Lcl2p NDAI_0G02780 [Naumovozyma dairenensis CBS 421]|uniref:Long chronological lifespan protein 2 n=1 Tax=Naumovozyma dairenensis (strain ATCC 10597 / BCRC 20456 / CBS 421 / NBRC 0211 / NRRL Y-12639) TaxID=1071378 RepID=G0WE44_NAUDC|nr:hypothetical protein NDAI_0G02780 [Naumovozyma dairenensis CBS 421]CCD26055.2 hypothetical protein NDAI_0G02780 [Naumovozyma dairenensis CBS 421]